MELVIITAGQHKGLLENALVKDILGPFNPSPTKAKLYLDNKCYRYVAIDDDAPLERIINALVKVDGVESVYEKPLDFPPM